MKSMSISVILDWIPDKYRIFYKSTGLDQLFRHARMLDDSMEIIDNDFLYLTQESSFLDREWDIRKPRFLIFCTKTGSKEGQINPSWMEHAAILYTDEPFHKVLCGHLSLQPDCPFFSNRKAAALYREISGKNRGNSLGRGYQFRLYTDRIHIS